MHTLGKSMTLSVAVLMGAAITAKAAEPAGVVLPEVSIVAPYSPYTSGGGQHVSSHNFIKVVRVPKPTPANWYNDPYTSGGTVCPEGGSGSGPETCLRIIHPSHVLP
jgi:hypothetical protein